MLTEAQVVALEKAKTEEEAHGEFESEHRRMADLRLAVEMSGLRPLSDVLAETRSDSRGRVLLSDVISCDIWSECCRNLRDRFVLGRVHRPQISRMSRIRRAPSLCGIEGM